MRAKKVRVVFETGELDGIGVTVTAELTLHADGTLTGGGVMVVADTELALAATGRHELVITGAPVRAGKAIPHPIG